MSRLPRGRPVRGGPRTSIRAVILTRPRRARRPRPRRRGGDRGGGLEDLLGPSTAVPPQSYPAPPPLPARRSSAALRPTPPVARPQSNRGLGAGRRSSPPRTATRGAARRRRRRSTRPPGPETLRCSCRCRGGAPDLTGRCRCRQGRCRWPLALAVGIGTVEAPDILLLGHSGRDKRGGHRRGGGRIGPGVDTKWGGLWRRDERQC